MGRSKRSHDTFWSDVSADVAAHIAEEGRSSAPLRRSTGASRRLAMRCDPVLVRRRERLLLFLHLRGACSAHPDELVAEWMEACAEDVRLLGPEAAIERLRDRLLPELSARELR
jgi:hypothetical protein